MESCVGIIAGNLPCLKPIFRSVLGSVRIPEYQTKYALFLSSR